MSKIVMLTQDEILEKYDKMMKDPRYNKDGVYALLPDKFLLENIDSLVCDGCGNPFKTEKNGFRFSSIHKGHPSNPLQRRSLLHLFEAERCRIRQCSNCGNTKQEMGKVACSKCKKPIERKTRESIWIDQT